MMNERPTMYHKIEQKLLIPEAVPWISTNAEEEVNRKKKGSTGASKVISWTSKVTPLRRKQRVLGPKSISSFNVYEKGLNLDLLISETNI